MSSSDLMSIAEASEEPAVKMMVAVAKACGIERDSIVDLAMLQDRIGKDLLALGSQHGIAYPVLLAATIHVALCMAASHTEIPGIHWRLMKMMREASPLMASLRDDLTKQRPPA